MHICYLTIDSHSAQSGGGIASYLTSIAAAVKDRGHRVTIIALAPDSYDHNVDGIRYVGVRAPNLHWYIYRGLPAGKSVNLLIREVEWSKSLWERVATIHVETPIGIVETSETANLWSCFVKDLPPIVVRGHGNALAIERSSGRKPSWALHLTRRLELMGIRRAAAITAPSQYQASELGRDLIQPTQRIHVIPNPLNPLIWQAAQKAVTLGANQTPLKVLFMGRLEDRKGIVPLLQAIPLVVAQRAEVQFVIAGGRHTSVQEQEVNSLLDAPQVREHVYLVGHVPWPDVIDWYSRATIFVMPSYYETFGISAIEAMAFGLPVVASTAGGLPEVVEDGVTGFLIPPGDSPALAEAICRLLCNPELRGRLGQAGRERVLAKFTLDQVVEQTLQVYDSVIG